MKKIIILVVIVVLYVVLIIPTDTLLRNQITRLTHTEASDISQCKIIPMGIRGCGGPAKYIVYSTKSTNVFLLKSFITTRDIITYPVERFSVSICSITTKPSSFSIVDGKCKAEYGKFFLPGYEYPELDYQTQ